MKSVTNSSPYKVTSFFIQADKKLAPIPVASSATNLTCLVAKVLFAALSKISPKYYRAIQATPFANYVNKKDYVQCALLSIPGINYLAFRFYIKTEKPTSKTQDSTPTADAKIQEDPNSPEVLKAKIKNLETLIAECPDEEGKKLLKRQLSLVREQLKIAEEKAASNTKV